MFSDAACHVRSAENGQRGQHARRELLLTDPAHVPGKRRVDVRKIEPRSDQPGGLVRCQLSDLGCVLRWQEKHRNIDMQANAQQLVKRLAAKKSP